MKILIKYRNQFGAAISYSFWIRFICPRRYVRKSFQVLDMWASITLWESRTKNIQDYWKRWNERLKNLVRSIDGFFHAMLIIFSSLSFSSPFLFFSSSIYFSLSFLFIVSRSLFYFSVSISLTLILYLFSLSFFLPISSAIKISFLPTIFLFSLTLVTIHHSTFFHFKEEKLSSNVFFALFVLINGGFLPKSRSFFSDLTVI